MLYVYMYLFIALFNFFYNIYIFFYLKTKQKIKQHFGTTVIRTKKKEIPKTFLWLHTHNKVLFPFK